MNGARIGKRVMVIGSSGSGKSTLAVRLGEKTGLPVIHLDKEYWHAGWVETPKEEWLEKQRRLFQGGCWIADGNYGGSLEVRLEKADTVIFLDYNRYLCLYRVLKRRFSNFGKTRADMAEGCAEKIDWPFLKFVWRFPHDSRNRITDKLKEFDGVKVIAFRNPKATGAFLESL